MTKALQLEKETSRIADAIVELVERADGPVTLVRLDREIPGFAEEDGPAWQYAIEHDGRETVIWEGMTEAGYLALGEVMSGGRVAVQFLNSPLPYFVGGCLGCENWMPIVLLPVKTANFEASRWLLRISKVEAVAAAEERGYRRLTPAPVRHTADAFSL